MILLKCLFIFYFICICDAVWKTKLTPKNLEEQFMKKCKAFGELPRTGDIYKDNSFNVASCGELWQSFYSASAKKDPCAVTPSDYEPFMKKANAMIKQKDVFKDQVRFGSNEIHFLLFILFTNFYP